MLTSNRANGIGNDPMKAETRYKLKFRDSVGWSSAIEPAPGGDLGASDLLVLVKDRIIPIELKEGEIKGDRIFLKGKGLRPAQGIWHRNLWEEGGYSLIAVGIERQEWMTYFVPVDDTILNWREGWFFDDSELFEPGRIYPKLESLVRFRFEYENAWTGD